MLLARLAINESTIPDRFLAPMLLDDSSAPADAIVVLGAGVIGDCVPNLNGMRRVLLGAKLFREGRAPLLVITGGSRRRPIARWPTRWRRLARDSGVPADKIVLERQSRNTHENGERTAPLAAGTEREPHSARHRRAAHATRCRRVPASRLHGGTVSGADLRRPRGQHVDAVGGDPRSRWPGLLSASRLVRAVGGRQDNMRAQRRQRGDGGSVGGNVAG